MTWLSANSIIISERGESMLTIFNRLRILGTNEDVLEIKAFLNATQKDEKSILDLKKIQKDFDGEITDIMLGYDIITFKSNVSVLPVITELSKRFKDVKLALQSVSESKKEMDNTRITEVEKTHVIIQDGNIISESKSSSKELETLKEDKQMIENKDTSASKKELVSRESLFDLQDKFFKDIQAFMKDFTDSFFKHWF